MFELPSFGLSVSLFLIVYGLFLLLFAFYSLFNVYNLIRYGFYDHILTTLISLYTIGTIILISISVIQMMKYDWNYSITTDRAVNSLNQNLFPGL